MATYINPYTDFGFKKLFGEEANKDVLIDFLNALLPAHHQISDLAFHNVEKFEDIPKFLNEPVFERAFATAKFTNLSKAQQLDYESSRLQYIGAREIVNTAKEEGIAIGKAEGKAEGLQITAKIIKLYIKGFDVTAIAEKLAIDLTIVVNAIAEYESE
jgi:PD-(D/E)XK nuclease family transposase